MNWQQLKAILWLRWRLNRNQFIKAGPLSAAISILLLVVLIAGILFAAIGGLAGGLAAGHSAKPETLMLICDGAIVLFLFIWIAGVVAELQRAESIDMSKLLHLPVTLKQVFLFNYVASHVTPSLLMFGPAAAAFCLGLAITGRPLMLVLGVVFASVILMITAWTYCLRGWLSGLMADRRKARSIAMWATILMVLLVQMPNLLMRSAFRPGKVAHAHSVTSPEVLQAHMVIPAGWIGYSAMTLRNGTVLPAVGFSVAALGLAAAGLARSHVLTLRFYRGYAKGAGKPKRQATAKKTSETLLVEMQLPFLREDTAGLALATLRSLLRAPEFKMTMIMPLVFLVVGSMAFGKARAHVNPVWAPFILTSVLGIVPLAQSTLMSNIFGLDRGGFRSLVLSPVPREQIMFARNLAMLPVMLGGSVVVLVCGAWFLRPSLSVLLTGLFQAAAGFLLFALFCNMAAILAPYRYSMNSLQAKKIKAPQAIFSALTTMLVAPVIVAITALPPGLQLLWDAMGWMPWVPINFLAAIALLAVAVFLYWMVLPEQGRLLQARELKVLREVTAETE